ncbi:unnamed protein product [Miscanthus lutarioriparius]|uniref:Uncharacterized protein n=1 Tax=Miscanthus lutarioriparius TaxID=422564 RepID=A0A811SBN4_9POAL|nr:unnamed protein product [Miscanthus lutarioriparius]
MHLWILKNGVLFYICIRDSVISDIQRDHMESIEKLVPDLASLREDTQSVPNSVHHNNEIESDSPPHVCEIESVKSNQEGYQSWMAVLCPRQDLSEALTNGYLQSRNLRKAWISGLKYLQMWNPTEKVALVIVGKDK